MYQAYLPLVKAATQIAAGMGVSKIVTDIVRNNVAIATPAQAVTVKVGSFILGSMLWEQSSEHIERQTNNLVALISKHTAEDETASE
jgi:hypothetical protein